MNIIEKLRKDFADVKFIVAEHSQWSPENKTIYYIKDSKHGDWSLLHEAGHMLSGHTNYSNDLGLLKMEVEAWEKARGLAKKYGLRIDEKHIDKCLDTYRDWIYKRSSCPRCDQTGIEKTTGHYRCINCKHLWKVSSERFCRTYRKTVAA